MISKIEPGCLAIALQCGKNDEDIYVTVGQRLTSKPKYYSVQFPDSRFWEVDKPVYFTDIDTGYKGIVSYAPEGCLIRLDGGGVDENMDSERCRRESSHIL